MAPRAGHGLRLVVVVLAIFIFIVSRLFQANEPQPLKPPMPGVGEVPLDLQLDERIVAEAPPAEQVATEPVAAVRPPRAPRAPKPPKKALHDNEDIGCRKLTQHLKDQGCVCTPDITDPKCTCNDPLSGVQSYPMADLSFDEFRDSKLPSYTIVWDMLFVYRHVCDHYCSSKPEVGCTLKRNKMNAIKPYDLIYVDTGYALRFTREWLPFINVPVHIISTGKAWNLNPDVTPFQGRLLNSSRVIRWFGSNANYTHEKVHFVPVGVHRKTRDTIANVMEQQRGTVEATKLAYANFNCDMTFRCPFTDRFIARHNWSQPTSEYYFQWPGHCFRRFVQYLMALNGVAKKAPSVPPAQYYIDMLSHKMIISPPGVGVDAFRTWESLSMGRVPVVAQMPLSKELYETGGGRVPVIQVKDWNMVTPAFLEEEYEKLRQGGPYNPGPLYQLTWDIHVWKECVKSSLKHRLEQTYLQKMNK